MKKRNDQQSIKKIESDEAKETAAAIEKMQDEIRDTAIKADRPRRIRCEVLGIPQDLHQQVEWLHVRGIQPEIMESQDELQELIQRQKQIELAMQQSPVRRKVYHPIFTFAKNLVKNSRKKLNRPEIARAYIATLPKVDLANLHADYPGKKLETHFADKLRYQPEQWST